MNVQQIKIRLSSKFPDLRRQAVHMLAASDEPERITMLLEHSKHEADRQVFKSMMQALIIINDPAVVPALLKQLNNPPYTGAAGEIEDVLVHFLPVLTIEKLLLPLSHESALTRMAAIRLMGAMKDVAALPALVDALRDENINVVSAAVQSMVEIDAERAIHNIQPLLDVLPAQRQAAVLRVFREYSDAVHIIIPELIALADQSESILVKRAVIHLLGDTAHSAAIPYLSHVLEDEEVGLHWTRIGQILRQSDEK